jgi:protein SCO1
MSQPQRMFTIALWCVLVVLMIGMVASGLWPAEQDGATAASIGNEPVYRQVSGDATAVVTEELAGELPVIFDVPDFLLTDQNNSPVSNMDLQGKVWVGAFMFTDCPGVCPMMARQMLKLQDAVSGTDVKMISFSLDPEKDTPEVVKAYLEKIKADPARWSYLVGPKQTVWGIAEKLKVHVQDATPDEPIVHGEYVALVDRAGKVRGYYIGTDIDSMKELAKDARRLWEMK